MAQVKYVGGNGPLEIPTLAGIEIVENDGKVEVSAALADELVARGDFKKATGSGAAKEKN